MCVCVCVCVCVWRVCVCHCLSLFSGGSRRACGCVPACERGGALRLSIPTVDSRHMPRAAVGLSSLLPALPFLGIGSPLRSPRASMAGTRIDRFYCDQGWTSQFLTKMQNLGGFGPLSVCRHRAWYLYHVVCCHRPLGSKSTFWNTRAKVGLYQAII